LTVSTTPESLEILSRHFQSFILRSKGRKRLKVAIMRCAGGETTTLMFELPINFKEKIQSRDGEMMSSRVRNSWPVPKGRTS